MTGIGRFQITSRRGQLLLGLFVLLHGFAQPTWAGQASAEFTTGNKSFNPFAGHKVFNVHAPRAFKTVRTQSRRDSGTGKHAQRSMSEAIAIAKQKVPGEVVSARKQITKKGEVVYQIKILSNQGVVRSVRVRASH